MNSGIYYQNPPNMFARETPDSPMYMIINQNNTDWATCTSNKMYKVDNAGAYQWHVGKHQDRNSVYKSGGLPQQGNIFTFKQNVGVVNE